MTNDTGQLDPATERVALLMLARAARASMENPSHPNASARRSRKMEAVSVLLDALARGDTEGAHQALDAFARRKRREEEECNACEGRGCSWCRHEGVTVWFR